MAPDSRPESTLGGTIGAKVADHLGRVVAASKERSAGYTTRLAMAIQEDFFRLTGGEVKRTVGPLWERMGDHPDAPEWLRQTGQFVGRGHGQWQTLLASTATGAAMGGGIMSLISNEMQPVIGAMIRETPNTPLSPSDAATATALGLTWGPDLWTDAGQAGVNRDRFNLMVEMARPQLGAGEVIRLYRMGTLSAVNARTRLRRQGYDDNAITLMLRLSDQIPSVQDAAAMWARSAITDAELVKIGEYNGYDAVTTQRYAEIAGEPPAPELLYTAFRRGIIDSARLKRGIVQGPIRNEWFDVIERMQFHSMTPEQAAGSITQGHMTLGRGQEIAKEYGLDPSDFATLVKGAGLPPGIDFAREAWDRGFITDSEYDQMFLESRIKNEYLPLLRKMRVRLLPQELARSLHTKGVITKEYLAQILHGHGFSDSDVESLVAAGSVEKTAKTRDLSMAQISELYAEREIDKPTAVSWLTAMGYDSEESEWILSIADLARVRTFRNAIINRTRAAYVKGIFDDQTAGTALDRLQVPPERKADLLQLWDIERTTVTRDLTPAQIVAAAKKGKMDPVVALSRLIGQGYGEEDATILLSLSGVTVP